MLIDTKELFKCETCRYHQYYGCNTFCDAVEAYSPNINKLTAVDAVPVVHGEWEFDRESAKWGFALVCSSFGKAHDYHENYCPNCGAKMDGERKDDGI